MKSAESAWNKAPGACLSWTVVVEMRGDARSNFMGVPKS